MPRIFAAAPRLAPIMRLILVSTFVILLVAAGPAGAPAEATAPATERPVAADTLRFQLTAGDALVVPLPGPEGATFRGVRLPALSWIVDRSFGWRSLAGERGREYIKIARHHETRRDTLVLVVDVE
jgi:hypothetical protein